MNKVPQTILSRVQRFDFKRLTTKQITGRLKYICEQEKISTDAEALGMIAEKADGSMRDALTFFDQAYAFTGSDMNGEAVRSVLGIPPTELYFSLLEAIERHDIKGTFSVVDKASEIGVEFAPLLDGFAKFLRNRLYVKVGGISPEELNISEAALRTARNLRGIAFKRRSLEDCENPDRPAGKHPAKRESQASCRIRLCANGLPR